MSAAQFPPFDLLTPAGVAGGVAVLALRGLARHAQAALALRRVDGVTPLVVDTQPRLATLVHRGEVLDQVLAFDRPDRAQLEVHTHGSPALLAAVGATPSPPREEFDRLLARAMGDEQLALALEQRSYPAWRQVVAGLAALPAGVERDAEITAARARSRVAIALAQPTRIVLCGVQNAGKSTLFNRLLFRERALTGATPGLTRDPVRDFAILAGYPYELVDTAGEGPVRSTIDVAALDLARGAREQAALRVVVVDGSRETDAAQRAVVQALRATDVPVLTLINKLDLTTAPLAPDCELRISCLDPAESPRIRARVGDALRRLRGLPTAGPVGGPAALTPHQLAEFERAVAG